MNKQSFWTGVFTLVALPLLFAGCGGRTSIDAFTNDAEQARAHEWIDKMRRGESEAVAAKFDPSLADPKLPAILAEMATMVPAGEPTERKLIGAQRNIHNSGTTVNLTYQYRFGEQYRLLNCATLEKDGNFTIIGMNVSEIEGSLEETNAFTLEGKSLVHFAVLALAVMFPTLILVALYLCVRERNLKRKWLWVLMIIFGVMRFSLDWTTGAWTWKPISFLLFSVGALKPTYGSLMLSIALPAGAVAYLLRRRNSRDTEVSNPN